MLNGLFRTTGKQFLERDVAVVFPQFNYVNILCICGDLKIQDIFH